jgi:hypothetical protein
VGIEINSGSSYSGSGEDYLIYLLKALKDLDLTKISVVVLQLHLLSPDKGFSKYIFNI